MQTALSTSSSTWVHPRRQSRLRQRSCRVRAEQYPPSGDSGYYASSGYGSVNPQLQLGQKIEKFLQTPFDLMAFGPRVTLGAVLSAQERLQNLPNDIQKLQDLMQDPRPVADKQLALMQEIEDVLAKCAEAGVTVESGIVANVKALLPPDVAANIPFPEPPTATSSPYTAATYEADYTSVPSTPAYTAQSYAAGPDAPATSLAAAEIMELNAAVTNLKTCVDNLRENTAPSQTAMLRLNLRESRDRVALRLQEITPSLNALNDPDVATAVDEAALLLVEVDQLKL